MSKSKKSPCVDICRYTGPRGWCAACGMTREESRGWKAMKPYARAKVLKDLPRRKSESKS